VGKVYYGQGSSAVIRLGLFGSGYIIISRKKIDIVVKGKKRIGGIMKRIRDIYIKR